MQLVNQALEQRRLVQTVLDEQVLPAMASEQNSFAKFVSRKVARDEIFEEAFLRDLSAFISDIQTQISDGTAVGWQADEYHVDGGYEVRHLTREAKVLRAAVDKMHGLSSAVAAVLDALRAERIAAVQISN